MRQVNWWGRAGRDDMENWVVKLRRLIEHDPNGRVLLRHFQLFTCFLYNNARIQSSSEKNLEASQWQRRQEKGGSGRKACRWFTWWAWDANSVGTARALCCASARWAGRPGRLLGSSINRCSSAQCWDLSSVVARRESFFDTWLLPKARDLFPRSPMLRFLGMCPAPDWQCVTVEKETRGLLSTVLEINNQVYLLYISHHNSNLCTLKNCKYINQKLRTFLPLTRLFKTKQSLFANRRSQLSPELFLKFSSKYYI